MGSAARELRKTREDSGSDYVEQVSTVTATGSSQTLMEANQYRFDVEIDFTGEWWVNPAGGTAAVNGSGCYLVNSGSTWWSTISGRITGRATSGSASIREFIAMPTEAARDVRRRLP